LSASRSQDDCGWLAFLPVKPPQDNLFRNPNETPPHPTEQPVRMPDLSPNVTRGIHLSYTRHAYPSLLGPLQTHRDVDMDLSPSLNFRFMEHSRPLC